MPGMDSNNPVVKLCGAGIAAEAEGRLEVLPDTPYARLVRAGVTGGQARTGPRADVSEPNTPDT